MSSISIEKINDVYIRVISDRSIEQELADRFTFLVEGYKFTPAYKSGVWDGKIRLYNLAKKTIYAGLLHHILKYAEENELTVNYLNQSDVDVVEKVKAIAPEYGFVLRFPKGKSESTGVDYEDWHFRYVGKESAKYMTDNNLSLEEYIALLKENKR